LIRSAPPNKGRRLRTASLCRHPTPDRLNVRRDWLKEAVAARMGPAEGQESGFISVRMCEVVQGGRSAVEHRSHRRPKILKKPQ
jgi:hypothetical protein